MVARFALSLALVASCCPALAREHKAPAPQPTLGDRLSALAPGSTVDASLDQWSDGAGRNALDVAFGPADSDQDGVAVWHADGPGRDSTMRRAGIGRIVLRRSAAGVVVQASAPAVSYASR